MLHRLTFDRGVTYFRHRKWYIFERYIVSCHRRTFKNWSSSSVWTSADQIRKQFLDFFVSKYDHTFVPSSNVVLQNDPSLLFVNSGMNQFKPIFLENSCGRFESLKRATNSQKCIRVGGKHNDLDDVGKDLHHHTFFEMLGNWSFADYFKEDACRMAWELLTNVYRLPSDRLYVTYFGGDENLGLPADLECRDVWLRLGVEENHILPFGSEHNFWEMGDTGPCGPCTEIHYDHLGSGGRERVNAGSSLTVELWNLVFMQYNRLDSHSLVPLIRHHVDTGMGMERLTSVLQNKISNYDTDLFTPLLDTIHKKCPVRKYSGKIGKDDDGSIDATYRTIADHARAVTVAIADGVTPDKRSVGHLLRNVMRKVFLSGQTVMRAPPELLCDLAEVVTAQLSDSYPELGEQLSKVKSVIREEEAIYRDLLEKTSESFMKIANKYSNGGMLPGREAFHLYIQSGLSEEVIEDMASRHNLTVDWDGFRTCHEYRARRDSSVKSHVPETNVAILLQKAGIASTDDRFKYERAYKNGCYEFTSLEAKIVSLILGSKLVNEASAGSTVAVVLDKTNFYSESGGQVGDKGSIINDDFELIVEDTKRYGCYVSHFGTLSRGTLRLGDVATLKFDEDHRKGCMRNHTATHLLHSAIKQILPETVQKSSRVNPHKLHFEFSAKKSFTLDELNQIEEFLNIAIKSQMPVHTTSLTLESALQHKDVITLPEETYPDRVRMVRIDDDRGCVISRELCCGTHVENTSDLDVFIVTGHRSSGLSIKSVTALTGLAAKDALQTCSSFEQRIRQLSLDVSTATSTHPLKCQQQLQEISQIRWTFTKAELPLQKRHEMEESLHRLDRQCSAAIRRYDDTRLLDRVTAEWSKAMEEHHERMFVICVLKEEVGPYKIFKHLNKFGISKPAMAFVRLGSLVAFQCWVPEHCVVEQFNANLWANHIATIIGGDVSSPKMGKATVECHLAKPVPLKDDDQFEKVLLEAKSFVERNI